MSEKFVVAVSGGVDSVVLLHMLKQRGENELVVAHFDHGIRDDSSIDAEFVRDLAKNYDLKFETRREELGTSASEELARDRRYEFLRSVAKKHNAKIVTAHHSDDVVETIGINLTRGTGWRGLAVLDSDIVRPLLGMNKNDILKYAKDNGLTWHEDSTNASDNYLRNRIRRKTSIISDDSRRQLLGLRSQQVKSKQEIEDEVKQLIGDGPNYSRYFFNQIDEATGLECLRYITKAKLTRPQLKALLLAVKTARPGSKFQAGSDVELRFTSRNFSL
jgi:tRNA(Ile)-lysidine synthase